MALYLHSFTKDEDEDRKSNCQDLEKSKFSPFSPYAQEIPNGRVLLLSPIEGVSKEGQNVGIGYLDKMNENIENLRLGLKCK